VVSPLYADDSISNPTQNPVLGEVEESHSRLLPAKESIRNWAIKISINFTPLV